MKRLVIAALSMALLLPAGLTAQDAWSGVLTTSFAAAVEAVPLKDARFCVDCHSPACNSNSKHTTSENAFEGFHGAAHTCKWGTCFSHSSGCGFDDDGDYLAMEQLPGWWDAAFADGDVVFDLVAAFDNIVYDRQEETVFVFNCEKEIVFAFEVDAGVQARLTADQTLQ